LLSGISRPSVVLSKTQLIHAEADLRFTLQNYNFSMNPQGDAAFLVKNLSNKKINHQCHGQAKPDAEPDDLAFLLFNPVALHLPLIQQGFYFDW